MTKTTLITGASSGFGKAMAEALAPHGHRLILAGRRTDRLQALADSLETHCHVLTLDVRDSEAVGHALGTLPTEFADVDVLINNAGLALGTLPAQSAELDDWEQMVDTNIKGLMYCTRAILPGMVTRNRGHIINIGSIAAHYPYMGGNAYGATKAFVAQFSKNLRTDLLGKHIRVTCIEPGMAETEFSLVRFHGDDAKARAVYQGIQPLSAEDVAQAVLWALQQPAHVNINHIELMPTMQAAGGVAAHRE